MLLKGRLTLTMLLAGVVPLLVAVAIIVPTASSSYESRAFDQLSSLRAQKGQQIEKYFLTIQDQIRTFAESETTKKAMAQFAETFDTAERYSPAQINNYRQSVAQYYRNDFAAVYREQNGTEVAIEPLLPNDPNSIVAQYNYISNNPNPLGEKSALDRSTSGSEYDRIHATYHPTFRNYLEKFGYYDIFLVEPETGVIVYSVFKELDYGTSLLTGPYSETNFARSFKRVLQTRQPEVIAVEDFEPYTPSYEAPAAFIAAPIFDESALFGGGDTFKGVLIFQAPVDRINAIMQNAEGMGESGETYLVGSDRLMRSQSRFTDEPTLLALEVDTLGVNEAISGQQGTAIFSDYRGVSVMSSYAPLEIEGLEWAILAEIDESEALAALTQLIWIAIAVVGIAVPAIIVGAMWFARGVERQLGGDPSQIDQVAQAIASGDLAVQIDNADKSVGVLSSMVSMRDNLKESIEEDHRKAAEMGRIKQALDKVSSNVMMADDQFNIIYVNESAQTLFNGLEAELRKALPNLDAANLVGKSIDIFHKDPSHQRAMLSKLDRTYQTDMQVADLHMRVIANPVINAEGVRLGTVVEWQNRTDEVNVQTEVAQIVNAAKEGDLGMRISVEGKTGFYELVSQGVNELVEIAQDVILDTNEVLSAMADGDLTRSIERDYKGAFEELKRNTNATVTKLTQVLAEITAAADEVRTGAEEIEEGNRDLAVRTEEQAASLEETAASMEEMTASVSTTTSNTESARKQATDATEKADQGGKVIKEAVRAVGEINDVSRQIATIINVIDEIAFQTNLLALNASVEAARAGEHGRGFSVVASEVRSLSQRTASSAKEIKDLINDSLNKVDAGTRLVHESGEALSDIIASVVDVSESIGEIARASQEQNTGISQVNVAVTEMDSTTQQNASLVDQASSASENLSRKAEDLHRLVSFFKVSKTAANAPSARDMVTIKQPERPKGAANVPAPAKKTKIEPPALNDDPSQEWEEF